MPRILDVPTEVHDLESGELIRKTTTAFRIAPVPEGHCQECARKHEDWQPHDASHLQYQYTFYARHHRWPTWIDAVAHCAPEVRAAWRTQLIERNVWPKDEHGEPLP